jgi:hypothetical protein
LFGKFNLVFIERDKPVEIYSGEIMILLPHTILMIGKISCGEQRAVKFQAVRNAYRKEEKITGGNKPGKSVEKPRPPKPGKINCYAVR